MHVGHRFLGGDGANIESVAHQYDGGGYGCHRQTEPRQYTTAEIGECIDGAHHGVQHGHDNEVFLIISQEGIIADLLSRTNRAHQAIDIGTSI